MATKKKAAKKKATKKKVSTSRSKARGGAGKKSKSGKKKGMAGTPITVGGDG
jgi:hypothetical protein